MNLSAGGPDSRWVAWPRRYSDVAMGCACGSSAIGSSACSRLGAESMPPSRSQCTHLALRDAFSSTGAQRVAPVLEPVSRSDKKPYSPRPPRSRFQPSTRAFCGCAALVAARSGNQGYPLPARPIYFTEVQMKCRYEFAKDSDCLFRLFPTVFRYPGNDIRMKRKTWRMFPTKSTRSRIPKSYAGM